MLDDAAHRRFLEWLESRLADRRVVEAFARVPRECFVPPDWRERAYADYPLPIGGGQTISQPLMVAIMTEALQPRPDDRVLEVGTGSGYQAAILAQLVRQVVTVERLPDLLAQAEETLARLRYTNVECHPAPPPCPIPWSINWPRGGA